MSQPSIASQPEEPHDRLWRRLVLLTLGLTVARLIVLFVTPLELYPDEAQYWLWSRDLAFGYYSKPPMLAWLIALTTGIGGDSEPWVRLSSPLLHALTGLVLFKVGERLFDRRTAFWAGVLYVLMPGVQLSAGIASTDAPLLFFASLALWAYVTLQSRPSPVVALLAGLALGGAFLSKYASLYLLIGVGLHLMWSREARAAWSPLAIAAAVAGFALVAAPNLIWNALNDFSTVAHTAANANWRMSDLVHPAEALEFLLSQTIMGPVSLVALLIGAGRVLLKRQPAPEADRLLLAFVAPPLVLVFIQAFLSRANANWAAVAYAPAMILTAAWLVRWGARRWLYGAVAFQAALAALVLVFGAWPTVGDRVGLGGSFKRVRGWETGADRILTAAEALGPGAVIAADDRFLYNSLAYYGRDRLTASDAPELTMWVREASARNQAEAVDPLTPEQGRGRVLMASIEGRFRHEFVADFEAFSGWTDASVRLDPERTRDLAIGIGEGFNPRPRDPVTGLPVPVSPTRP